MQDPRCARGFCRANRWSNVGGRGSSGILRTLNPGRTPHIVFTQWPIDTHPDHQIAGILTYRAWLSSRGSFELYYYEVDFGAQTMLFHATDYVDITSVREKKKSALFANRSQHGEEIYRKHHEIMENFRGREAGVAAAEAFIHLARIPRGGGALPGLPVIR